MNRKTPTTLADLSGCLLLPDKPPPRGTTLTAKKFGDIRLIFDAEDAPDGCPYRLLDSSDVTLGRFPVESDALDFLAALAFKARHSIPEAKPEVLSPQQIADLAPFCLPILDRLIAETKKGRALGDWAAIQAHGKDLEKVFIDRGLL